MNILHINDKIENGGGVETNIQQLCELGIGYGLKTHWIGVYENNNKYHIKQHPEKSELVNGVLSQIILCIQEFCNTKKIDIIHVHSISNPKLLEALFKLRPVVRSMRDPRMFCPGQGKFWRNSERICDKTFGLHCVFHTYKEGCCNRHPKRLLKAYKNVLFETTTANLNYSAIIVMSNYMLDEAVKAGFDADKIYLNPHLTPSVDSNELVLEQLGTKRSLLYVGRLSRTKGVHYMIDMGLTLLKKGFDIQIDIVGDGEDKEFFKSLIPVEFKESFIFHGWKSRGEVDKIMKACYLLIFPSIYPEAFGISGIEAMMRGKPVVGFDVGGVSTWLKNDQSGYLVPVKDIDGLTEKTILLLNDQNLYKKMGKASRAIALREFSAVKHMSKLLEIYKNILNTKI
ncbi:glycosyltransferase family 4 protein [Algibacter sp.]|nr:glycosyltransferase family 4 protein [Algibacter sp.]MDB4274066.1 glycosyltransferase family 4 protein [Algibacter sp.]